MRDGGFLSSQIFLGSLSVFALSGECDQLPLMRHLRVRHNTRSGLHTSEKLQFCETFYPCYQCEKPSSVRLADNQGTHKDSKKRKKPGDDSTTFRDTHEKALSIPEQSGPTLFIQNTSAQKSFPTYSLIHLVTFKYCEASHNRPLIGSSDSSPLLIYFAIYDAADFPERARLISVLGAL